MTMNQFDLNKDLEILSRIDQSRNYSYQEISDRILTNLEKKDILKLVYTGKLFIVLEGGRSLVSGKSLKIYVMKRSQNSFRSMLDIRDYYRELFRASLRN
jgi:hypothetical protein